MGLVGNSWVNCFRTHNKLTMGLPGIYPLAPSVLKQASGTVRATLAPCNCKLLQGLLSWWGVPIGSLLGLSIAKREQPRASGVFLLVVVLSTASAGKGNVRKEGILEGRRDQRERE